MGSGLRTGWGELRAIANGLIPGRFDAKALTPEGRDEVREAIDVVLKIYDRGSARLSLALEQLDTAAAEIDRLRNIIKSLGGTY